MRVAVLVAVGCLICFGAQPSAAACNIDNGTTCRALDAVQRLICRPGHAAMLAVLDDHRRLRLPIDLVRCDTVARRACAFVLPEWQPICSCTTDTCCPPEPEEIFALVKRGRRARATVLPGVALRCRAG